VDIGDAVSAGAVLATLENSSQRAALVQAQGAYEAASAASAQSGIGVNEADTGLTNAKNNAVSSYRSAYNTVNSVIFNNVDTFFSSPASSVPGIKLDGFSSLSGERVAYQEILPTWEARSQTISTNSNLEAELSYAKTQVERTITLVDTFITAFNSTGRMGAYSEVELESYSASFTTLRSTLIATLASLDSALVGVSSAEDAVERATLAASGGGASASDAQVKIALGSLQAAQSNYQKTIIRTPIQGVVNAFYLKSGDYVSPGQPAGIVANNNGLQIKTYVSESDSVSLSVGDSVTIEGGATGVITAKSAAIDPSTGKVAIIVGVNPDSSLSNGSTVKVTFAQITQTETNNKILIPLSALKITPSGSQVFTIGDGDSLQAIGVTTGQLYGENIEILEGVSKETRIVTDARGLKEGQKVTIKE
jgi:multidrug resistance efflux pump